MDISRFKKKPVLGILRGVDLDMIEPLIEAVMRAGLETIEITMNTKNAVELIKKCISVSKGRLAVGAGTVVDMKGLHEALDAGATFIIMPVFVKDVVDYCVKNKIPVFPGAFSPREIHEAWKAGSTMVKVFPSGFLGPDYFKEVKGPFNDVELLACGGVTPDNVKTYLKSGASAIAFGASVFKKEWLTKRDFQSIERLIKAYLSAVKD